MQNYINPYYQNWGYPSHFVNAMQQQYNTPQQTQQVQQQTQQVVNAVIPVSAKEEATATPIDLINGTPTFFYNKGKNEIYLKQFDVKTGAAVLKTFIQLEGDSMPEKASKIDLDIDTYKKDINYLKSGIDSLHKMLAENDYEEEEEEEEEVIKPKKKGNK